MKRPEIRRKNRRQIMQMETMVQWVVEALMMVAGIAAGSLLTLAVGG
jgi:hypothetical protein